MNAHRIDPADPADLELPPTQPLDISAYLPDPRDEATA